MKISIISNTTKPNAVEYTNRVVSKLISLGIVPVMYKEDASYIKNNSIVVVNTYAELAKQGDLIITIGGDGTIIHAAKYAVAENKPLLGINFGRVGFVATMEPEDIDKLENLLTKDYIKDKRMLLSVEIHKNDKIENLIAVNDAVVSRGSLSRMIDLFVYLNGEKICDYRSDGIILATPTGSTAYSLSAGGPVIQPELSCILFTPICPHTLFARSLVFGDNDVVTIEVASDNDIAFLTVDGQVSIELSEGDRIVVSKYKDPLTLITMEKRDFYTVLNNKLIERGVQERGKK